MLDTKPLYRYFCFNNHNYSHSHLVYNYYKLPLAAADLIGNKSHKKCDIYASISQHIHLINTSYFGECSFDESYGSTIWEVDFDNHKSIFKLKEMIIGSLRDSLKRHEKRLMNLDIHVKIKQEELLVSDKKLSRIKKKVEIEVLGKIRQTNEPFKYNEQFYIGPLSY